MSDDINIQTQNLTRLIWERLENISCYDFVDYIVISTLTLHTNFQNLKVWESQENMLKFNRLGHSSWGQRLKYQESDGLITREHSKGEIFTKKLRQNYLLTIPSRKYESCEDWEEHYFIGSHEKRTKTKKPRGNKSNLDNSVKLPENLAEQYSEWLDFQDRLSTGNLNPLDEFNYFDQI